MFDKVIMVIDDDEDILYTIRQICLFQKWEALTATGFLEAEKLLRGKAAVDLVLVDYHLPEMDGVAVVRELRKRLPKTPIIALTVEEQGSVMNRFMEAGADDYALKPIKAVDLISRIKVHVQYYERNRFYENHTKGISKGTLDSVVASLRERKDFASIGDIEALTGIKRKTLYRYLQYMVKEGMLELDYDYQDAGRPKTRYRFISSRE